jgi:hypothetical protein
MSDIDDLEESLRQDIKGTLEWRPANAASQGLGLDELDRMIDFSRTGSLRAELS